MTVILNNEEYLTTKNGYLRRKDNPSRKVKEEDVVGGKKEIDTKKKKG